MQQYHNCYENYIASQLLRYHKLCYSKAWQTKNITLSCLQPRASHNPHDTWHGDRGGPSHFCTSLSFFFIWSVVSPLGVLKICGKMRITWLSKSNQIKNLKSTIKIVQTSVPCGAKKLFLDHWVKKNTHMAATSTGSRMIVCMVSESKFGIRWPWPLSPLVTLIVTH